MKENNELFTIITCTYNRGGKLNKLFDSLTKHNPRFKIEVQHLLY